MKIRNMAALVIAGCMFASGIHVYAASQIADADGNLYAYSVEGEQTGESDNPEDYSFDFQENVEASGKNYTLNHVEYSVISAYEEKYGDTEIPTTEVVKEDKIEKKDGYKPEKSVIEKNGLKYRYKSSSFSESDDFSEKPIDLQSYTDSDYTIGTLDDVAKPDTISYEYEGKNYALSYDHAEKIFEGWKSGYTIQGTIYDYDAPTIMVGSTAIEPSQLTTLSTQDLQSYVAAQGYNTDTYRFSNVSFAGEPYVNADKTCRDYTISVDAYVRQYRLYYTLHDKKKEALYTAENTYELSADDVQNLKNLKGTYTVKATAYYDEAEQKKTEKTLPVAAKVAIAFGVIVGLVLIAALILYLVKGGRKGTDYRSRRDSKRDYKNL